MHVAGGASALKAGARSVGVRETSCEDCVKSSTDAKSSNNQGSFENEIKDLRMAGLKIGCKMPYGVCSASPWPDRCDP